MIVNVRMTTGELFQFASRKDLRRALGQEADTDDSVVPAWVKWNREDPGWTALRATFIRKHSVAFVVAAEDCATGDEDLPAKELAQERLARWRKKTVIDEQVAEAG